MTYKEVEEKINEIVGNPDKAHDEALKLLEDLKLDYTNHDTASAELKKNEAQIAELRDTNMRLFLKVQGGEEYKQPEPPSTEELVKQIFGG